MSSVLVKAETKDGQVLTMDAALLDEMSWREFILRRLVQADILVAATTTVPGITYKTPLTAAEVQEYQSLLAVVQNPRQGGAPIHE